MLRIRAPRPILHLATAVLVALSFAVHASARGPSDDWYLVSLAGQPCGYMHSWQSEVPPNPSHVPPGSALLEVGQEMMLRVGRAGQVVSIRTKQVSRERFAGAQAPGPRLIASALLEAELGGTPTVTTWTFVGNKVLERVDAVRRKGQRESDVPPGDWLPPGAAQMLAESKRASGESPFSISTLDFESGLRVATLTSTKAEAGSVTIDSRAIPVTWWSTTSTLNPFVAREGYAVDGSLVELRLPMEIGEIVMTRSTKALVLERQGVAAAPELLVRSLAPIVGSDAKSLARAESATYLVSREVPASGHQAVLSNDASVWRITVSADAPAAALVLPPQSLPLEERAACLAPSVLIDSDDEHVRRATTKTLEDAPKDNVAHRAELLRRSTYAVIRRKDLASAFASASDAIVSRAGDCTEHAVLLAAMLRADGIPSRVACGMVSAESFAGERNVFAWHMWTQAWIDGRWVDLDATLPDRAFHPGHVLCATTPLSGGALDPAIANLAALIGGLRVEVVDVR